MWYNVINFLHNNMREVRIMHFREKLIEIRKTKGMSLREFSKLTGISHTNIARYEKGFDSKGKSKEGIYLDTLKQICERSGYNFRLFLEETGYIEPSYISNQNTPYEIIIQNLRLLNKAELHNLEGALDQALNKFESPEYKNQNKKIG